MCIERNDYPAHCESARAQITSEGTTPNHDKSGLLARPLLMGLGNAFPPGPDGGGGGGKEANKGSAIGTFTSEGHAARFRCHEAAAHDADAEEDADAELPEVLGRCSWAQGAPEGRNPVALGRYHCAAF